MITIKKSVELNAVFIEDKVGGGFTGYFAEFPEAIAEGETLEDAETNLGEAFKVIVNLKATDSPR